ILTPAHMAVETFGNATHAHVRADDEAAIRQTNGSGCEVALLPEASETAPDKMALYSSNGIDHDFIASYIPAVRQRMRRFGVRSDGAAGRCRSGEAQLHIAWRVPGQPCDRPAAADMAKGIHGVQRLHEEVYQRTESARRALPQGLQRGDRRLQHQHQGLQ